MPDGQSYHIVESHMLSGGAMRAAIPQNWRQGRTAYGGITAGLSLAAALNRFDNLPPLRSAIINFIGPVTGDLLLDTDLLRQGRNVTSIAVRGHSDDKLVSTASFIFGARRELPLSVDLPASATQPPQDYPLFTPPNLESGIPAFFHNFETRLVAGHRPMSRAEKGYIRTWSRHKDPASRTGLTSLMTLSDVLPPAASPLFGHMGAISSVNFMFNLLVDHPVTQDGWWHVETTLTAMQGGYASQIMRFWNSDGVLIAEGMQCVALFM